MNLTKWNWILSSVAWCLRGASLILSPLQGGYLMPPALREEIHFEKKAPGLWGQGGRACFRDVLLNTLRSLSFQPNPRIIAPGIFSITPALLEMFPIRNGSTATSGAARANHQGGCEVR